MDDRLQTMWTLMGQPGDFAPEELTRLLSHPDPMVREMAVEYGALSDHDLEAVLSHEDPRMRRTLALWRTLPAWVQLRLLADHDRNVRRDVLRQDLPVEVLLAAVVMDLPFETEQEVRRMLEAVISHDPMVVADVDDRMVIALARRITLPGALVAVYLGQHRDEAVRVALARSPLTPPDALAELARDEAAAVRGEVAMNLHTDDETTVHLANDADDGVRIRVAKNAHSGGEALVRVMALDPDPGVRAAFARSYGSHPTKAEVLSLDPDVEVRRALAGSNFVGGEAFERLATDPEVSVRVALASSWRSNTEDTLRLTQDPAVEVRVALASQRCHRIVVFPVLAHDPAVEVRRAVASYAEKWRRSWPGRVERHCVHATMGQLAHDDVEEIRLLVAAKRNAGDEALLVLSGDPSRAVRLAVARNKSAPGGACDRVMRHVDMDCPDDQDIRVALARHPNTRAKVLEQLAVDTDPRVRRAVAAHRNANAKALATMADDPRLTVRRIVLDRVLGSV